MFQHKLLAPWWVGLRLASALAVFIQPVLGYWWNFFLDAVDGDLFEKLRYRRSWYQRLDKSLDLWFYIILLIYVLTFLNNSPLYWWLVFWFMWRMAGTFLFLILNKEWLLVVFPNVFSELFWLCLLFPKLFTTAWGGWPAPWLVMGALLLICLFKEWWLHVAKIDLTDLLLGRRGFWRSSPPMSHARTRRFRTKRM